MSAGRLPLLVGGGALVAAAALLLRGGCAPSASPTGTGAPAPAAPAAALLAARDGGPAAEGGAGALLAEVPGAGGLAFTHHLSDGRMDTLLESVGSGACVLDADGDGRMDVYLVDMGWRRGVSKGEPPAALPGNRLFRGRGDGTFEDVTERAGVGDTGFGFGALAADVDRDGDTDLYVLNDGPNRLYRNRGDGTFEDATERSGLGDPRCSVAGAFFDLEGDGDLDLYVGNYVAFDPVYTLHYAPDGFPGPLAYAAQPDALYENQGDGTFRDVTAAAGAAVPPGRAMGVTALDADGDGRTDLFVANDASANFLFLNRGGGRLEEVGVEHGVAFGAQGETTAAMAGAAGDVDGDGWADLLVTDSAFGALYRNRGRGRFEDRARGAGVAAALASWPHWGAALVDLDQDGALDLFAVGGDLHHRTGRPNLLLLGRGDGTFADGTDLAGAALRAERPGRGLLVLDPDDDGDLDLVVTHVAEPPVLLRNAGRPGRHGITLSLEASPRGRSAVGAVLTAVAGGRTQVRRLELPTSYLAQHDPRVHLGLGAATSVERLEVRWADGSVDTWRGLEADRAHTLRQGGGRP